MTRPTAPELDRRSVLARRAEVQDLSSPTRRATDVRGLGVGLQDTPRGSGLAGVRARTAQPAAEVGRLLDGGPLVLAMTVRGAPHVLARAGLGLVTAALVPLQESEAEEVATVAAAMRAVAGGRPVSRPALSGALNDRVPDTSRSWCERCGAVHVREELFRRATLHAGLELDPNESSPVVFRPITGAAGTEPEGAEARAELVRRFVHLLGVTRPDEVAAWLGHRPGEARRLWDLVAGELQPVQVEGRRRWALASDLDALRGATGFEGVRLLPPSDPYLLGDRALVVPDRAHQRLIWRAVANPGVVLADGEIAGLWRHRMTGRRLTVAVTPFAVLSSSRRAGVREEAERVAALRGADRVELTFDS
ncbi:winged helix DNA-binding domain-containing protein [Actinomadura kijaniata]|uniref:winged helix DNA-binding domain-containing protein n=1 Tax=Actinomadura kijaniata TaxID=46161 RepID=UPI00082D8C23|nr:winged helix DNA-binding domain-containing protein [Actinomadura kijaniata]